MARLSLAPALRAFPLWPWRPCVVLSEERTSGRGRDRGPAHTLPSCACPRGLAVGLRPGPAARAFPALWVQG